MGVLPMVVIVALMLRRRVKDHHVSDKRERPVVIGAIAAIVAVGLSVMMVWSAPIQLVLLVLSGLFLVISAGTVTLVSRYKVSFHAAVAWGQTLALAFIASSPWVLVAVPIALATSWARLRLGAHTRTEVLVGSIVGCVSVGAIFVTFL
ncbi:hypothetical protein GOEFS_106_01030 [Gordonia effusa NBRC 100432]|uniref:Phosphatidic acid phosphatase type 2/haloperoxidase domain-containing protein n=2 Tax=Gordonia effusa TaxID=263908 RepID=H0R554_9ACTN|nr:hypothetical protein GOEFS_106_01030 [Gordonia effusa NBRC 100432]